MIKLNVGAMRPAQDDARAARVAAANDLVQRTLAQHGLGSGSVPTTQDAGYAVRDMQALLAKLGTPGGMPTVTVPDGAAFRSESFSCAAGTRSFRTYVPVSAGEGIQGLVMMLHGCTQTAEDFAIGTGMNALAEKHRLIVVYPQQSRGDNAQSCWNWFNPGDQRKGRGEPSILASIAQQVTAEFAIPPARCFVAGLSAGGAMAMILARSYPDVFAAVGVHSGLPHGAAQDVPSAFAAMGGNIASNQELAGVGRPVRCIVFHGTADATVHPSNADAVARQALEGIPRTIETEASGMAGDRAYTRRLVTTPEGEVLLEHWSVAGGGHSWFGGQACGSHTDTQGPDASAEMVRFLLENMDA